MADLCPPKTRAMVHTRCTVNFVQSYLVETEDDMKAYDLIIRILEEDGSMKGRV